MTTTDPLPAFLALPDGEPEPVSETALTWLSETLAANPTVTLEEVLTGAEELAAAPDSPLASRSVAEDRDRAVLAESKRLAREFRWEVDGPGSAEWALRKLRDVQAEQAEVNEQADAWVRQIEEWRAERLAPLESRAGFFTGKLTDWLRWLREADPRVKSKVLPSGEVLSRSHGAKVVVTDEDRLVAWARETGHEDVLKVTTKVLLSELKRVATLDDEAGVARDPDSGQPVPGTAVTPGGVSFSVKVGG